MGDGFWKKDGSWSGFEWICICGHDELQHSPPPHHSCLVCDVCLHFQDDEGINWIDLTPLPETMKHENIL